MSDWLIDMIAETEFDEAVETKIDSMDNVFNKYNRYSRTFY